jgi:DNA-binding XRE family transcriptional regulator
MGLPQAAAPRHDGEAVFGAVGLPGLVRQGEVQLQRRAASSERGAEAAPQSCEGPTALSLWSSLGTAQKFAKEVNLERPALRPEQSRMARAAMEWSLEDAASAAGVSRRTVLRFERYHRDVQPELIQALRRAYEETGVRFLEGGADDGGVVPAPLRVPSPGL